MTKKIRIKREAADNGEGELRQIARSTGLGDPADRLSDDERKAVEKARARDKITKARMAELTALERDVVALEETRGEASALNAAAKAIQGGLLDALDGREGGYKITLTDPADGSTVTGTLVKPKPGKQIPDEEALRELVERLPNSKKVWAAITVEQVDGQLVAQAVADGLIPADELEKVMEDTKPSAPHIRTSRKGTSK